jgi:hypothetical protein
MGFLIILCISKNQQHTLYPHFASFPKWTPRLSHHSASLTAPSQYHSPSISSTISFPICELSSIHLPHTKTYPWGPHPPPVLHATCALIDQAILHWGTHFYICTLIPNYSLFLWQFYKSLCFQHLHSFLLSPLETLFFSAKKPMSSLVRAFTLVSSY